MDKEKLKAKIMERVEIDAVTGCWNWKGCIDKRSGSGVVFNKKKKFQARRLSFELFIGEIFETKIKVLNNCKNIICVNPEHSFLNCGSGIARLHKELTHCPKGHVLDGIKRMGTRFCLTCNRNRSKKYSKENYSKRGIANKEKTHCNHGHSLHDCYIYPNGSRQCRTCRKALRAKKP